MKMMPFLIEILSRGCFRQSLDCLCFVFLCSVLIPTTIICTNETEKTIPIFTTARKAQTEQVTRRPISQKKTCAHTKVWNVWGEIPSFFSEDTKIASH